MCFTVAVFRNNTLMTAQEYYDQLPQDWEQEVTDFPDQFFISGFSYPHLPILRHDRIQMASWGLVPAWVSEKEKALEIRSRTLNARGETVFEKPSFSKSILSQRGIFPVRGFYEWRDYNKLKYPYFIEGQDKTGLNLGVIYDHWEERQTGRIHTTFSIVTTPANPLMATIHNTKLRMPLVIDRKDMHAWLDPSFPHEKVRKLISPYPEEMMNAYTISRFANSSQNNRNVPGVMDHVSYPELTWDSQLLF